MKYNNNNFKFTTILISIIFTSNFPALKRFLKCIRLNLNEKLYPVFILNLVGIFIITIFLLSPISYSQQDSKNKFVSVSRIIKNENRISKSEAILAPKQSSDKQIQYLPFTQNPLNNFKGNTSIRWSYTDPLSIGYNCAVSGNGNHSVTGWACNNDRISLYGNLNSNPIWEYSLSLVPIFNYVAISDTGGVIAAGSYQNIYLFNNLSSTPFFNFDLSTLSSNYEATHVALTNDGSFLVGSGSSSYSSIIIGFNSSSTIPVWTFNVTPSIGSAWMRGINISGNDSLIIVNTYSVFYVLKTYTGELIYEGLINPTGSSGTGKPQGISGDGSIIATMNYDGYVRVYQWTGTTYNLLWYHKAPPHNWITSIDVTYNGDFIACGTLLTAPIFEGDIRVFKTSSGSTPLWTYSGCGDEVWCVSFSKSGNILAATSFGALDNSTPDFYLFKTFLGNVPILTINTPGSLFGCSTSRDGKTVVTTGKSVHATILGNGGFLFNIDVDTNDIPISIGNNQNFNASKYRLSQNYPNPFNPTTKIKFELPKSAHVKLIIYNIQGRIITELLSKKLDTGKYEIDWNATDYPSGVYFYKLSTNEFSDIKKMILVK